MIFFLITETDSEHPFQGRLLEPLKLFVLLLHANYFDLTARLFPSKSIFRVLRTILYF